MKIQKQKKELKARGLSAIPFNIAYIPDDYWKQVPDQLLTSPLIPSIMYNHQNLSHPLLHIRAMPTLSSSWEEYPFPPYLAAELLLVLQTFIQIRVCEDSSIPIVLAHAATPNTLHQVVQTTEICFSQFCGLRSPRPSCGSIQFLVRPLFSTRRWPSSSCVITWGERDLAHLFYEGH